MNEIQIVEGAVQSFEHFEQLGKLSLLKQSSFPEELPHMVSLLDGVALREDFSSFDLVDFLVRFGGLYEGDRVGLLPFLLRKGLVQGEEKKRKNHQKREGSLDNPFQIFPLFS